MLDNINTPQELKAEAEGIHDFLDLTMSEEAEEAIERGNDLSVYISRTGKMLADAKYHKDELLKTEIMDVLRDSAKQMLSASTVNELVKAACKEANYQVNWIERLNKTATHQLEWCRTVVSKAKADQYAAGGVSGSHHGNQPPY